MVQLASAEQHSSEANPPGAQTTDLARSLAELRDWVRVGDAVLVTRFDGSEVKGEMETLSPEGLKLRTAGARVVSLSDSEVFRVDLIYPDPLWNGALIGAAVGTGVFLLLAASAGESEFTGGETAVLGGLLFTGPGAGIGAAVDGLTPGRRRVYSAGWRSSRVHVSLAPILALERRGILVAFQF